MADTFPRQHRCEWEAVIDWHDGLSVSEPLLHDLAMTLGFLDDWTILRSTSK
jgi:hypothetical protein